MILVSEIRPELHRQAQGLIPERYSSFDELLNVALENQLLLEERGPGPLARPDAPPGRSPSGSAPPSATTEADVQALDATQFSSLPEPPDPNVWSLPLLWGQINRFLPAMAGVRVLGHLQLEGAAKEVPLAIWHERAAAAATSLHAQLLDLDHQAQRRRGDLWSIGFPSGDRASTRRYANQFLGRGSRRAPGAAEMIGLVAIRRDGEVATAAITASGVELSVLENPVFDCTDPSETISETEADLFLQVLARQLPEERAFMALMAKLIEDTDSRVGLEQELIRQRPDIEKYASTMRAGAIGRLHDLGFLSRTREGTKVRYSLSSRAAKLGLIS